MEPHADADDIARVGNGLRDYNGGFLGDPRYEEVRVFLRDERAEVVGGLLGHIQWKWLYVSKLWIVSGKAFLREVWISAVRHPGGFPAGLPAVLSLENIVALGAR